MSHADGATPGGAGMQVPPTRMLELLQRLLAIPATELLPALNEAAQLVHDLIGAEKVDVLLLEPEKNTLVAFGGSDTPMTRRQRELGLDRMPVVNGGRIVETYLTGATFVTGQAEQDPLVLPGVKGALGVRSMVAAPFEERADQRGVLTLASTQPDFFSADDMPVYEAVARWVGLVVQRARLVEDMRQQAQEQARRLAADEVIAVLAHDLRNLVTPVRGRIQMMTRLAQQDGDGRYHAHAGAAMEGIGRVERLIGELLDSARLEQGTFAITPEPVDLAALAREVVAAYSAEGEPITLTAEAAVPVLADPGRVRQALENLVANALRHTPEGTQVDVRVWSEERQDLPWGVVSVRDKGVGIPPELLPRLFSRFAKGTASAGLGLGLYIARRITEAHGGKITARSSPGMGAAFEVLLPADGSVDTPSGA